MEDNPMEVSFAQLLGMEGQGGELILEDTPNNTPPVQPGLVIEDEPGTQKPAETEPAPKEGEEPGEKPVEESKPAEVVNSPAFLSLAKKYLEDGKWSDVVIDIDGKQVKLSEATDIDEETFFAIEEDQRAAQKEEIEKEYISVKDVDEDRKRLINIIKNGGDLKEIFQNEAALKKPFEGMDLTNEKQQTQILYWQLTKQQGLEPGEAEELVKKAVKELSLDSKVEKIVKFYQDAHEKNLADIEKNVAEERQKEEAAIKDYRKNLSSLYKADGISDSLSKRLVDAATKKDETGNLVVDSMYEKLMEDPKEARELIFFILERENFLKAKGATIKKDAEMNLMRNVKILRETKRSTEPEKVEEKPVQNPFGEIILGQ